MSTEPKVNSPPAEARIVVMSIDYQRSCISLLRSDAKEASFPLESVVRHASSAIGRISWLVDLPLLQVVTTRGDEILAELPEIGRPSARRDRPVIYLDQNHWSTIANALHDPRRVKGQDELAAALRIVDLSERRKVILPLSAGHMAETCKWTNDEARYRLALTILRMSGGWLMRDPLAVRRFELRRALLARHQAGSEVELEVFTLEPDAISDPVRGGTRYRPSSDFPEETRAVLHALVCSSAIMDTLLDGNAVPMAPILGWTGDLQRYAEWIADQPQEPASRRQQTNLFFLHDIKHELATEAQNAELTLAELGDWTRTNSNEDIAEMPALGLFREVLFQKLVNAGTRWKSNDLTDLMYLTCAAGYADHVVGERSMTAQMRSAHRRTPRIAKLHRSLAELSATL